MSAANALLTAIHARLSADAALTAMIGENAIHDRLLDRTVAPYLVIGEMESRDWSTVTEGGGEHLFSIAVRSKADGRREAESIAARVRLLLHDAALALDGFALVNLLHLRTRTRREPKTAAFAAELFFRAVTE